MTIESPLYLQTGSYSARQDRFLADYLFTEGVTDVPGGELVVSQRAAGANMSVDVAIGSAVIDGDDVSDQGSYIVRVTGAENVPIAAPDVQDRIDLIVLRVYDSTSTGGDAAQDGAALEVVKGTPAASPTAPALPNTAIPLAQVHVAAGAASIATANITDERGQVSKPFISFNGSPDVFTSSGTWTVPAGCTEVDVVVIAGGYGGQGGGNGGIAYRGTPGKSAPAIVATGVPVTPATNIAITVGAGGTGGAGRVANGSSAAGTAGLAGGQSSFGTLVESVPSISAVPLGVASVDSSNTVGTVTSTQQQGSLALGARAFWSTVAGFIVPLTGAVTPQAGSAGAASSTGGAGQAGGSAGFVGDGGGGGTGLTPGPGGGGYGGDAGSATNVLGGDGGNGAANSGAGGGGGGSTGGNLTGYGTGGKGGDGASGLVIVIPR